jgi:isocitrate dehydrogenase
MTGDLMRVAKPDKKNKQVYTEEFIDAISKNLKKEL